MTKTQQEDALHKKRFGQYFSGKIVADMLFSLLPKKREWHTVVDPMVGIGDMLVSVTEHTSKVPMMLGVEIDDVVAQQCAERIPEASILAGDAFKCPELITPDGWDLVITNPPYVRYQLQAKDDEVMPSALEIRESLVSQIGQMLYLSDTDRALFQKLARNYSGLADMAVPAWILCAALVKKGGYLAVVVPETWLNRDYASPIQYLLRKCFHIESIVRDTNANWFADALVKTCLVVARREETQILSNTGDLTTRIIEADLESIQPTSTLFPQLKRERNIPKWALDEDIASFSVSKIELQHEIDEIIGGNRKTECVTLAEMGVECGQGLRTGANDFFYLTIGRDEGKTLLVHSKAWDQGGKEYHFYKDDIVLTLQNRGEIDGLVVTPAKLKSCVVYPHGNIQGDLEDYIASAEKHKDNNGKHFKDYSAVRPNEKRDGTRIIREWFRLPQMTKRHLPNLCLTRVSAKIPECLYISQNDDAPIAVDANMVTLWSSNEANVRVMLAMLNSTWSKLYLELICTVMGGGALKIEASHLRRLLLPRLPDVQLNALEKVGERLIAAGQMDEGIQKQIDSIVFSQFEDKTIIQQMQSLIAHRYNERSTRL